MAELLTSVGIEYETVYILPGREPESLRRYFSTTHDASIETDMLISFSGLLFSKTSPLGSWLDHDGVTVGTEYVSTILDSTDEPILMEALNQICNYAIERGEPATSDRAGIHVHVCYTNPSLNMLKEAIKLWRHLEDLFYLVGGMGYPFRGIVNDAAYCRPLTKYGPIVVPVSSLNNRYIKTVDIDDLLDASNINQFWERWGDIPRQVGVSDRYFPVRYHGFNISPAYNRGSRNSKGTIEFRVFNITQNPLFLRAIIKLCSAFAGMAMINAITCGGNDMVEEHSIFDNRSKEDIKDTFLHFADRINLDGKTVETILHIIEITPQTVLEPHHITTHLRNIGSHWRDSTYPPKEVDYRIVKPAKVIDIHTLRGER